MNNIFNSWGAVVPPAPPKKSGIEYKIFTGEDLIKVIEINKKTIVSEVIKFRIDGNNKYYGNMVLKFNEDNLNDPYLDIYKLINDCPQIKKSFYEKRKVVETSDILYMVVDRLNYRNTIKKQFNLYETIFLDNNGYFVPANNENYSYTSFELKFIIFHYFSSENSGHYTAFSKIRGKWYKFNDLSSDYAENEIPPLIDNKNQNYYPVCFYYVKNNAVKYNSNLHSKNLLSFDNYNELINPYEILGITEEECKNIYQSSNHYGGDSIIEKYYKQKKYSFLNKKKLLLSYFILFNIDKFERIGNSYKIKIKEHFYYVIMDDLYNLQRLYEQNKYILSHKDNFSRNLLHYSVIGEYYEMSKFLLEKGINFDEPDYFISTPLKYSTGSIRQLLINYGSNIEIYNQSIVTKGLNIKFNELNKIDIIYNTLLKNKHVSNIEYIKNNVDIIGKRLIRNINYINNNTFGWKKVYHGTKYVSMEHILIYGLRNFGEPLNGHIPLGQKINNINNWAQAIFVTPSIFYASNYSETINSDMEEWYIIIEAKIKPDFYSEYEGTIYKYKYKIDEPKKIEYRIKAQNFSSNFYGNTNDEEGIATIICKKEILRKMSKIYRWEYFHKLDK